jgi:predicted ATPase with chaperone activity
MLEVVERETPLAGRDNTTIATLLSGEKFWPSEPRNLHETGLPAPFVESLLLKLMLAHGKTSGRQLAQRTALPFNVLEPVLAKLRTQQHVAHAGAAPLNDYYYTLSDVGKNEAQTAYEMCRYLGPAPVPLMDYIISVEAQAISDEAVRRDQLEAAFQGISVEPELLNLLGPAVNSASGMFLYGAPGNGKSTLAQRITSCFGQEIWIPHAMIEDDCIIKVFDPAYHAEADEGENIEMKVSSWDRRWVRIRRPTVVVGGELTMDNLEIRHDTRRNISEAPLQLKSNCGCLLIDDFGRQRISPAELLNRWIVPLEARHDFLTLSTGKKIEVPFEQLIIFSTNLDPADLVDEAFLRRIPYKIEITDPGDSEIEQLFRLHADSLGCEFDPRAVEYLLQTHYRPLHRPRRRCHPRDIMKQVNNFCRYHDLPLTMSPENFDHVSHSFFTNCLKTSEVPGASEEP